MIYFFLVLIGNVKYRMKCLSAETTTATTTHHTKRRTHLRYFILDNFEIDSEC